MGTMLKRQVIFLAVLVGGSMFSIFYFGKNSIGFWSSLIVGIMSAWLAVVLYALIAAALAFWIAALGISVVGTVLEKIVDPLNKTGGNEKSKETGYKYSVNDPGFVNPNFDFKAFIKAIKPTLDPRTQQELDKAGCGTVLAFFVVTVVVIFLL